jgi:hypothetical protein
LWQNVIRAELPSALNCCSALTDNILPSIHPPALESLRR